jgi:hypothetical protein
MPFEATISPMKRVGLTERPSPEASEPAEPVETESTSPDTEDVKAPDQEEKDPSSTPSERPTTDSEDFNVKVDLNEVPQNLRPEVEKWVSKIEKDFKGAYTKKTQDLATERKAKESQFSQLEQEIQQYRTIAQEVLSNPQRLDHYRQLYGFQPTNQAPAPPPKIETVEDLLAYNQQQQQQERIKMQQESEQRVMQLLERTQAEQRWETALVAARMDPKFVKYEKVILATIKDPSYKQYYTGKNEADMLKRGFEEVKNILREDLEAVKQETIKSMKAKSKISTAQPKTKHTPMESKPAASKEEIIARVREKHGPE